MEGSVKSGWVRRMEVLGGWILRRVVKRWAQMDDWRSGLMRWPRS